MSNPPRVCLVSASGQNVFFGEIMAAFGQALRDNGFVIEESVDCFPPPAEDLVYLYVPHEYNPLVSELAHPSAIQLSRTVAICTEQPGTPWFEVSCELVALAGSVVDINVLGVQELRQRGIDALHAPLGYIPAWDAWHGERTGERSIDLLFLGSHTERRAKALAGCSAALEGRRAAIHLTETVQPHVEGSQYFFSNERKWELLADSSVILNVHRHSLPYMEWHRVIGAILNGCVVLSEHSLGVDPLVPGRHFVSAGYDHLPRVLEALLSDPERLEEIRHEAYSLVREQMPMDNTVERLSEALGRAAANPLPAGFVPPPAPPPLPSPLAPTPPRWQIDAEHAGETLPQRMALKHLVVQNQVLHRRIDDLSRDRNDENEVQHLGPRDDPPRVSVLLTIYNYRDYVGEALRSVALSDLQGVEVIAVDDCSTDGSAEIARDVANDSSWLPVTLVRRGCNRGLPAARNLALEHARGEYLFILDADNTVLPQGLAKLARTLDNSPDAAFAYGILECFGIDGPSGLLSWMDWDPEWLRHGNYVDAMAMIRRSALETIGGYSTEPALYGWEDFDMWIAMASRGMRGVRVPDFVGRYRVNSHSMLSLANIDSLGAWSALLRRHPALAGSGPHSSF